MTEKLQIVYKQIADLRPSEYNPRQLTEDEHTQITASLQEFSLVDPIIVNCHPDRENVIVGGHARTRIAKELGYTEVPCILVCLPLEQEKRLNIRLNKNVGSWDWDALSSNFDTEELVELGFTEAELEIDDGGATAGEAGDGGGSEGESQKVCCPECGHKFKVFAIAKGKNKGESGE